jgi:hypothetical protein
MGRALSHLRHGVTYRDIEVHVYPVEIGAAGGADVRWLKLANVKRAAVSELARKIARAVG